MHNREEQGNGSHESEEPITSTANSSTAVQTPEDASDVKLDGTWGERDVGGPVCQRLAMEDYEEMRKELTRLSVTRSRSSTRTEKSGLFKSITRQRSSRVRKSETGKSRRTASSARSDVDDEDVENGPKEEDEEFELDSFIRNGYFEKRTEAGASAKKVGVIFKNLTVKGAGSKASFVRTLPDAVLGTFGPDLYRISSGFLPALKFGKKPAYHDLIRDFTGVVRDGEMMLVLGRPGSGCSTFLKAIANNRGSYAEINGDVSYGGMSAEEQNKTYKGEVNYNPENDEHLPSLTVWQTLNFSLLNKTRKRSKGEIDIIVTALMRMFGISHTRDTFVGNEYVRGVSGGERKRVSIAETLATKSTVVCWDNSSRGLDSSTALDYANSLRVMTDISNRTTFVSLYQAGEGIYEKMDKVLVIDDGYMLFQGPATDAKKYFIDLGFEAPDRITTADFLTSIADPAERQFRKGCEASTPKTPEELAKAFRASPNYQKVLNDILDYERHLKQTEHGDVLEFQQSVQDSKSKTVSKKSSYTVSYWRQIIACTRREFWLLWGDKTTLYTKFFIIVSNGLIVGSLFYGQSFDTSGAFSRGGTAFFSILFLGWLQLSELMKAVSGRAVVARHHDYAFYRPSAVAIARVITDLPMVIVQVIVFGVIMYFLTDLDKTASKFFIYISFVYITTLCITALYRMLAALSPTINDAVRFSGISLNLLVVYTGYVIAKPLLLSQKIWFGWIYYINPLSYAFEGVISNEFHGRVMQCNPEQLVPRGPGILLENQGCAISGANPGSTVVSGDQYIGVTFAYTRSNLWRNFGVVIAFTVLYIIITAVASETLSFVGGGGGALIFKKSKKSKQIAEAATKPTDEEKAGNDSDSGTSSDLTATGGTGNDAPLKDLLKSEAVFTWRDVGYSVPYMGGERKLLNGVNGFAKPGVMVALMGASGAGKTTLLNALAQRQKMGIVSGEMLVDGRALGREFQRGTG